MTVIELVDRERARLRRMHVLVGVALAVGATCLLLALGASALGSARWMALPRPVPFLVWVLVIAADVAVVLWTLRRLDRRTTRHSVAATIEREQSLRAGSLRGALEVGTSGALGRRAAAMVSERLAPAGPRLVPGEQRALRRGVVQAGIAAAIAVAALLVAAPNFNDGLQAILEPVHAWNGTLLPRISFANLPPAVLRGETLRLQVAAAQRGTIMLSQRVPGEAWVTQTVSVDRRTGIASVDVGPLRGDLRIVATDGRSASDTVLVKVTDRPFVGAVSMRATYPAYLGRAAEAIAAGEPARVPQGTVIDISGRASTSLRGVRMAGAADTTSLRVNDHAFEGRFEARKTGRYAWLANGVAGPIADVPAPMELEVVPDSVPHVEMVSPATDTVVAGDDKVTVRATASDDHGISRVELVSWKQGSTGGVQAPLTQRLAEASSTVWDGSALLDLATRGLKAGDALHVRIVVTDNSPWAQRGESRELLLKVPTMEERRTIARSAMDSAVSQARAAAQAEKSLQQRTSDAARDRTQRNSADAPSNAAGEDKKGNMSYDAAEKAKAVAKDQRALADQVKQLQQAAAQLEQQLKNAGALDSSLARQLQEAQSLLRDALTPELMAQMNKLDNATQNLSRDQAQTSLKDLQAMQQKLREQLEKSAEMLKRAALEGSMQTLKDEARDIAERDKALADSASKSSPTDPQKMDASKAEAKQLADRSQRFEDELKKLQDRLEKDKADAGASGTEEARKRANASQDAMRQAAGDQKKGTPADKSPSEKQSGDKQSGDKQSGQPQKAGEKTGEKDGQKSGEKTGDKAGEKSSDKAGEKSGDKSSGQSGQKSGQSGEQSGVEDKARDAASQMERASDAMKQARESQVNEWKSELTNALDQSIQEMLQMARQEQQLQQKAKSGQAKPEEMRGEQSAIKQGLDNAAAKLNQEGQKTSLLSGRSQRSVSEAQQKVSEAMQSTSDARGAQQAASSLGDAADALNRAAASLARDREKANSSNSATGFSEMMQQLQDAAKKQGSINAQAQGMMPGMGQPMSSQQQATSRALAREQRQVAQQLDDVGEAVGGDRAAQLAKEAKQLADALEGGRLDATTVARQQQLFRRLLDAGRSLEKEEREDTNKREAKSARAGNELKPANANATGKSATKFHEPTWEELRGLSADERRAILEYFKRINAPTP
jgi:hypothetical protein